MLSGHINIFQISVKKKKKGVFDLPEKHIYRFEWYKISKVGSDVFFAVDSYEPERNVRLEKNAMFLP